MFGSVCNFFCDILVVIFIGQSHFRWVFINTVHDSTNTGPSSGYRSIPVPYDSHMLAGACCTVIMNTQRQCDGVNENQKLKITTGAQKTQTSIQQLNHGKQDSRTQNYSLGRLISFIGIANPTRVLHNTLRIEP